MLDMQMNEKDESRRTNIPAYAIWAGLDLLGKYRLQCGQHICLSLGNLAL